MPARHKRPLHFYRPVVIDRLEGRTIPHMAPNGNAVSVIPSVLYSDAEAGIAWLTSVLGFREHIVYRGKDGVVEHAELLFGDGGMLMLGTAGRNQETAVWNALPRELGGKSTGGIYLIVPDCTPVWQRVQSTGTEVLMPLRTMDYGGKAFTVQDMDGHVWSLGEYSPWAAPAS